MVRINKEVTYNAEKTNDIVSSVAALTAASAVQSGILPAQLLGADKMSKFQER